ncbi:MAG: hypothetical protein E6Y25_02955, partial [Sneathia sanguinegens]|uniref:hypothetical protein n=1 Tax=Sneathia sanguinegens TaxID=40543 RepID=UPI00290C7D64
MNIIIIINTNEYIRTLYSDRDLRTSFISVIKLADKIDPVILPIPPKTTITNISIEYTKENLSGVNIPIYTNFTNTYIIVAISLVIIIQLMTSKYGRA